MLAGVAALRATRADAADDQRTQFYLMETFYLRTGGQPRLHDLLNKWELPALRKVHSGPMIVLESLVAPHMPQIVFIAGFHSLDELWAVHNSVVKNQELQKAFEQSEEVADTMVESQANVLLEAMPFSPEVAADSKPRKPARVFELRVYHTAKWRQLNGLAERFGGPEIKIFHRVGIHPILYASTLMGPNIPNLTYLIPFDSLAAREKAWDAFGADPEWIKVRNESIEKYGQMPSVIQIALYRATPYSPVQ